MEEEKKIFVLDNNTQKKPFIWFKAKDKGVERGFLGVKASELKDRLKKLGLIEDDDENEGNKENVEDTRNKRFTVKYSLQNINQQQNKQQNKDTKKDKKISKFVLFIATLILQSKDIKEEEKQKKIEDTEKCFQKYIEALEDCEKSDKQNPKKTFKKNINKEEREEKKQKLEKATKALADQLIHYDNAVLTNNMSKEYSEFIKLHKQLQDEKFQKNSDFKLYSLKSEYIIKGDNVIFAGMAIPSVAPVNIIRNLAEDHGKGPDTSNRNIITEFFALKFAQFLGGNTPENSYILKDVYEDGKTEKLMIASNLHEDFNDFQGKLIDSNTNEEQIGSKNYNRLVLDKQKVGNIQLIDDFDENGNINEDKTGITTALLVLSVLNDLDGVGAQGQNIGYNSNGQILFFDFGHSFENTPNLGAGLCPQLGSGNVKSRNIASFFAGIPLKNQLQILQKMLEKFEVKEGKEKSEFDEFVEGILGGFLDEKNYSQITTNYQAQIDLVKTKVSDRINYMKKIFKNRLEILKEENGKDIIDVLDNLQLLTFEKTKTKYSKNGIVLKEGTKYFDIKKQENGLYKISLKGISKYGTDKEIEYRGQFLTLVRKFRGTAKDAYIFSENELLRFKKFLLKKRLKQVKKLNDDEINKNIQKDIESIKIKEEKDTNVKYLKNRTEQLKCTCEKIRTYNSMVSSYIKYSGKIRSLKENLETIKQNKSISEIEFAAITDASNELEKETLQKTFSETCLNSCVGFKAEIIRDEKEKGEISFKILGNHNDNNDFNKYKDYIISLFPNYILST